MESVCLSPALKEWLGWAILGLMLSDTMHYIMDYLPVFRQHRTAVYHHGGSSVVQIGSKHGTPVTVNIADTLGGVLVTMSRGRNWLDKTADASEMLERAATKPISLLAMIPDAIGELQKESIVPDIWDAINDICALSRMLAGELGAPKNPKRGNFQVKYFHEHIHSPARHPARKTPS